MPTYFIIGLCVLALPLSVSIAIILNYFIQAAYNFVYDMGSVTLKEYESTRLYKFLWNVVPFFSTLRRALAKGYYTPSGGDYALICLAFIVFSLFTWAAWPVVLLFLVIMIPLYIMRFMVRTKKTLKEISKHTHTHPNTVEHEKVNAVATKI